MKCPICDSETEKGKLVGDRYALKWMDEKKKLFLGLWAFGGQVIDSRKTNLTFSRPFVNGLKCLNCKKIILDIE
ncbi:MAG: hypothetical protein KJ915_03055 [Candidatus Omnitrophica bacterium]|nr:hypothetical protein [Candidatus Omnitrophota bacterium]